MHQKTLNKVKQYPEHVFFFYFSVFPPNRIIKKPKRFLTLTPFFFDYFTEMFPYNKTLLIAGLLPHTF